MIRNLLAAVAAFIAGAVVVAAVQWLNYVLNPPPPGLDPNNPRDLAAIMEQISLAALLLLELSYVAGSLVAGFTAGRLSRRHGAAIALALGAVYTAFNVMNLVSVPHPLWLAVLSTVTFLPLTWLGARLSARATVRA